MASSVNVAHAAFILSSLASLVSLAPVLAARHTKTDAAKVRVADRDVSLALDATPEEPSGRVSFSIPFMMGAERRPGKVETQGLEGLGPRPVLPQPHRPSRLPAWLLRPQVPWPWQFPRPKPLPVSDNGVIPERKGAKVRNGAEARLLKSELASLNLAFWQNLPSEYSKLTEDMQELDTLEELQDKVNVAKRDLHYLTKKLAAAQEAELEMEGGQIKDGALTLVPEASKLAELDAARAQTAQLASKVTESSNWAKEMESRLQAAVIMHWLHAARADLLGSSELWAAEHDDTIVPEAQVATARHAVETMLVTLDELNTIKDVMNEQTRVLISAQEAEQELSIAQNWAAEGQEGQRLRELEDARTRVSQLVANLSDRRDSMNAAAQKMKAAVGEAEVELSRANLLTFGTVML